MTTQQSEVIPQWTLGDRLRKARSVTGLTTREFATKIGVSQATVTNAENDNNKVRRITLNAWSMATGVPLEWLETGHAPDGPPPGPHGLPETIPDDRTDAIARLAASKRGARRGVTHGYLPIAA